MSTTDLPFTPLVPAPLPCSPLGLSNFFSLFSDMYIHQPLPRPEFSFFQVGFPILIREVV